MRTGSPSYRLSMVALVAAAVAASTGRGPSLEAQTLEERVSEVIGRPEFRGSTFGILVKRLGTDEVILRRNEKALLPPASTTKLLSCGGALAILGKDFRWKTRLFGDAGGDLVLMASGDPNLSQRLGKDGRLRFRDKDHSYAGFSDASLVPGDPLVVLRQLALEARDNGKGEIHGDVIVDDGLFKETNDSFIGPFSAMCVNDNLVDITVTPGEEPGDAVEIDYQPKLPSVKVKVSARTGKRGSSTSLRVESRPGVASFELLGSIPAGGRPTLRVGRLEQPALAAAHFLVDIFEEIGVEVHGKPRRRRDGPGGRVDRKGRVWAEHVSAPLSEAIRVALKVSHNLHATMFPVMVGARRGRRADRVEGYRFIRGYFQHKGLDVNSVVIQSGSGGGRQDRLSAEFMVGVLETMARRADFPVFLDALPVSGVDGTLATRFRAADLRGRIRAKTGTLVYRGSFNKRWIYISKALAGYVDLRSPERPEEMLVFSITIANTVADSRKAGVDALFRAQEDILRAVIETRSAPADGGVPERK